MTSTHYDVLIIGSGFGGSVTAMRLAEKGYRVGVLEAGKRYDTDDLPASTLLGIQSLYSTTALFEYEGIAVVGSQLR